MTLTTQMAPSTTCQLWIKLAIAATLITSLIILPSQSDGKEITISSKEMESKKLVLGSRPPNCVNKCLSCNPCTATLVVPPRHQLKDVISVTSYDHYGDNNHDSYYLLAWKCKCGNKVYQP